MLGYFSGLDGTLRAFAAMEDFRRRVEHQLNSGPNAGDFFAGDGSWPHTSVYDSGEALKVVADVPGLRDKDLEISLDNDVLTVSGERKTEIPEGYEVHRQERRPARFSRSFTLPFKVSVERLSADLKDGILTITLPKAPEAQPRKIPVRAG